MAFAGPDRPTRPRIVAALAAAAIQLAVGYVLVTGLGARLGLIRPGDADPKVTTVEVRTPPPPPSERPREASPKSGKAAPPAPRATPLPQVAPKAPIVLATPTPAAPVAGAGRQAAAGAALAGTGAGAGGQGNGLGAGGAGNGSGGGEGGSAARRVAGGISDRDYPRAAAERGSQGTVAIRFRVRADGRVDSCRVLASSGDPALDDLTCELAERRFRYRPATDASGQPIDQQLTTSFTWGLRPRGY